MQEIGYYPRIKSIYGDGILGEGRGQVPCHGAAEAVKSERSSPQGRLYRHASEAGIIACTRPSHYWKD